MTEGIRRTDAVLAVALTIVGLLEATLGLTGVQEPWYVVLTVPFVTVPVVLRTPRATAALFAQLTALLLQSVLQSDFPGGFTAPIALVLVLYSVGAHTPVRRSLLTLGTAMAAMGAVIGLGESPHPANFVFMAIVVLAAWSAGYAVRMTEERSALLAERRAMEERTRIAGELHDVVSHNVSAMVVQAGAERRDQPPGSAAETLADIEQHGRQTLTELRRLLGVLGMEGSAPLTPNPGIRDIPDLLQSVRSTGLDVVLHVVGAPSSTTEGVSLAAYRVVQEGLTNVRKHSTEPSATVTLRWSPKELQVEVLDRGRERHRRLLPGAGYGLRAMAERVNTYGGTVTAGPGPDGFRVLARLPVEEPT